MKKYIFSGYTFVYSCLAVLFCGMYSSVHGATVANKIEQGLALSTIPCKIVAQHLALTQGEEKAAIANTVADIMNIANKVAFFYNNAQLQNRQGFLNRDVVVNGLITARDFTKLYQHLTLVFGKRAETNIDIDAGDVLIDQPSAAQYAGQVLALPVLQGVTAFALACAQNEQPTNIFQEASARNLATAGHSFTRLLEEYTQLEEDSNYRAPLAIALYLHVAWILNEGMEYKKTYSRLAYGPSEEAVRLRLRQGVLDRQQLYVDPHGNYPLFVVNGDCLTCLEDGVNVCRLHCGHATGCQDCLRGVVRTAANDHDIQNAQCPQCHVQFNRNDIGGIIGNDGGLREAWNNACALPAYTPPDLELLRSLDSARACPLCGKTIIHGGGCTHMSCAANAGGCGHHFCFECGDTLSYNSEMPHQFHLPRGQRPPSFN